MDEYDSRPSAGAIMQSVGISQVEAAEYLTKSGIKTSLGAVQAWSKGAYRPSIPALDCLRLLWLGVTGDGPMPEHAPESVRRRAVEIQKLMAGFDTLQALPQAPEPVPKKRRPRKKAEPDT